MWRERGCRRQGPRWPSARVHTHRLPETTERASGFEPFHRNIPELTKQQTPGSLPHEMMLAQYVTAINSLLLKSAY